MRDQHPPYPNHFGDLEPAPRMGFLCSRVCGGWSLYHCGWRCKCVRWGSVTLMCHLYLGICHGGRFSVVSNCRWGRQGGGSNIVSDCRQRLQGGTRVIYVLAATGSEGTGRYIYPVCICISSAQCGCSSQGRQTVLASNTVGSTVASIVLCRWYPYSSEFLSKLFTGGSLIYSFNHTLPIQASCMYLTMSENSCTDSVVILVNPTSCEFCRPYVQS